MNKNGKSSVAFLGFIPLFFVITIIIVDTLFNYIENKRFKNVTESIVSEVLKEDINDSEYKEEIRKRYERQGFETEMLIVETDGYKVYLENEHAFFGLFSSFSNKKNIETNIKILGITFKVKKNSIARIKVNASLDNEDKVKFEYIK